MRSAVRVTRVTAAASVVLTIILSAVAALGFSGRSTSKTSGTAVGSTSGSATTAVRLALPPRGQGGTLTPPTSRPVQNVPAAPAVTSGGS
jgi:hypothetical protein